MFHKIETEKYLWVRRWPITVGSALLLLLAIQIARVNRPHSTAIETAPVPYSTPGPLISGDLTIPSRDFHVRRIDLNRRVTLIGVFRTGNIMSRVSVLVLDEQNFFKWKTNSNYNAVAQTGYVPGGKIVPVLEPGTYFVVIDNRDGETSQFVRVAFRLE